MSVLRANGHPSAGLYPIGMVRDEASLVRSRINSEVVTMATLLSAVAVSVNAPEEGGKLFDTIVKKLIED